MSETLTITTPDGAFSAYVARPQAQNAPAVVVIQEIFGVNKVMRDICDGLAAQGFVAICPDLFWRIEPGIDITDQSEAEWKRAFALFNAFDVDAGVSDIAATIAAARALPGVSGKVGAVGFCWGGGMVNALAIAADRAAAGTRYGHGPILGYVTAHSIDGNIVLGFRCPERKSVRDAEVSRERIKRGPVVVRRENGMIFQRESFHSQSCCRNHSVAHNEINAGKCTGKCACP